jgi:hypothetical protein
LVKPFPRAVRSVQPEYASIARAHDDDALLNLRRTQHFARELRFPDLFAGAVECENLALRCAHQDDASITANTTRQRSLGFKARKYFAARGIKLNDLARCAGRVNRF